MAATASMPRTRGSLPGLALLVLGVWAGIGAYAGPAFGYGFSPGAWQYTQGRLFLSALPGAVAAVCGLGVMATGSRGLGGCFAFVAALAGAWLVVGGWAVQLLPGTMGASITLGNPVGTTARQLALADIGLFWGAGVLIVFFAAIALGRFSIAALKDAERLGSFLTAPASGGYQQAQAVAPFVTTQPQVAAESYASYSPDYAAQYPADAFPAQYQAEQYPPEPSPAAQHPSQYPPEAEVDASGDATQTQARP